MRTCAASATGRPCLLAISLNALNRSRFASRPFTPAVCASRRPRARALDADVAALLSSSASAVCSAPPRVTNTPGSMSVNDSVAQSRLKKRYRYSSAQLEFKFTHNHHINCSSKSTRYIYFRTMRTSDAVIGVQEGLGADGPEGGDQEDDIARPVVAP